ncbi:MAG: ATP-binding protein [Halobacteriota archaeon]
MMIETSTQVELPWYTANKQYTMAALARVRLALKHHIERCGAPTRHPSADRSLSEKLQRVEKALKRIEYNATSYPALKVLCKGFGLSKFERDVLLLCAGVEIDATFAVLCATAQGDSQRVYPTFSLALAALPENDWGALSPAANLRRWRFIELNPHGPLTTSPLSIDERILHHLMGVSHLDQRLVDLERPLPTSCGMDLVPSHHTLAQNLASTWARAPGSSVLPVLQLSGGEPDDRLCIAAQACASLGLKPLIISAYALPVVPIELEAVIRLCERELWLARRAVLLDCSDVDVADVTHATMVRRFIERIHSALIVSGDERQRFSGCTVVTYDVTRPSAREQCAVWAEALRERTLETDVNIERLVGHFDLPAYTIHNACADAFGRASRSEGAANGADINDALWEACRMQARPQLDALVRRVEPAVTWSDLVLPAPQRQLLREIMINSRNKYLVHECQGFPRKPLCAVFAGASGTGKTMAAEVLAHELELDLLRVDLSQVLSKWLGESEKRLARVFDAAEKSGAILLFDEADALFGKRSGDVTETSLSRYADMTTGYLLTRLDTFYGLVILTTNKKEALDEAFESRERALVTFPFPDATLREEMWRRVFPPETQTEGVQFAQLARLNVTGRNISNIAVYAAFLAAEEQAPVRMVHLRRAAEVEYAKMGRSLPEAEVKAWV